MKEAPKISPRPQRNPDAWVRERAEKEGGKTKRVTIDLPLELHTELKVRCVRKQVNLADIVRAWIEEKLKQGEP